VSRASNQVSCIQSAVKFRDHARITGTALKNWFLAQLMDSVAVGVLWLIGLLIIGVPWAPLWAFLGGLFQFVPNYGPILGVLGPAAAALLSANSDEQMYRIVYVLILYAIIVVVDGLLLQPYLMRRTVKVPIWASIFVPIIMGFVIPFWGVLLAPPLLAIYYSDRARNRALEPPRTL
jgi:predicted PurR-regulated permease PerM